MRDLIYIDLFPKCVLSSYYVLGIVLDSGAIAVEVIENALLGVYSLLGETDNECINIK